jgi:hypothetical protein
MFTEAQEKLYSSCRALSDDGTFELRPRVEKHYHPTSLWNVVVEWTVTLTWYCRVDGVEWAESLELYRGGSDPSFRHIGPEAITYLLRNAAYVLGAR